MAWREEITQDIRDIRSDVTQVREDVAAIKAKLEQKHQSTSRTFEAMTLAALVLGALAAAGVHV